jgi:hypothetical protein
MPAIGGKTVPGEYAGAGRLQREPLPASGTPSERNAGGSAYPVTIHWRSAADTPNSRWIVARATFTIEKSVSATGVKLRRKGRTSGNAVGGPCKFSGRTFPPT